MPRPFSPDDVRVSNAAQAILVTLLVAAILAGVGAAVRGEGNSVRIGVLEQDRPAMIKVGVELGVLTSQMRGVEKTLDEIRQEQKAAAASRNKGVR